MLFISEDFDKFMLREAVFRTSIEVTVDGQLDPAFYDEEEQKSLASQPCVLWKTIRPSALNLIKGKKLPLGFKIILLTTPEMTKAMEKKAGYTGAPATSLSLNITYQQKNLYVTTGIALSGFSMDKSLEKYWDDTVMKFLQSKLE